MSSELSQAHRTLADVVDVLEDIGVNVDEADVTGLAPLDRQACVAISGELPEEIDADGADRSEHAADVEDLEETIDFLEEELAEVKTERDEAIGELETERVRMQERVDQLTETINRQAEKIAELQGGDDDREDLRETLAERNQQLDEARRRAQAAERRVEELEADEEYLGDGPAPDELPEAEELFEVDPEPEPQDVNEDDQEDVDRDDVDEAEPTELPEELRDQLTAGQTTMFEAMAGEGWMTSRQVIGAVPDLASGTVQGYLSKLNGEWIEARDDPDAEDGTNRQQYRIDWPDQTGSDAAGRDDDGSESRGPEEDEDTEEDTPEDTVFVMTGSAGESGTAQKYHEDKECHVLQQATNYREVELGNLPHHEPCSLCSEGEDGLVYVTSGITSPSPTYHERRDCPSVKKADEVRTKHREDLTNKEPCKRCAVDEEDPDPTEIEIPEECDWLELPADVIVEDSSIKRDLEEILDVVERADGWLQVHKRIAASTTSKTKDLLWELGLRNPDGSLLDDDVLEERLSALRGCYVE